MSHSQLDLTERIAIEAGLCAGNSFKQIAARIHRDPTTVASEVQRNWERIPGHFFLNNDCRYARYCKKTGVCTNPHCTTLCVRCRSYDCRDGCKNDRPYSCSRLDLPPYVCNSCGERRKCFKERYMYSAKLAQSMADERRSDSRKGMHLTEEELALLNEILLAGIEKRATAEPAQTDRWTVCEPAGKSRPLRHKPLLFKRKERFFLNKHVAHVIINKTNQDLSIQFSENPWFLRFAQACGHKTISFHLLFR